MQQLWGLQVENPRCSYEFEFALQGWHKSFDRIEIVAPVIADIEHVILGLLVGLHARLLPRAHRENCTIIMVLAVVGCRENCNACRVLCVLDPPMELVPASFFLMRSYYGRNVFFI